MHSNLRERVRAEGGFTLIELLVVMIIIAILMAVAVPTFLSQKNNALKTQATANIKQVITAMESCAAQIPSGGYREGTGTGAYDCSSATTLTQLEASLQNLKIQSGNLSTNDQTQVALDSSGQGFIVQRRINDSGETIFFAEIHTAAGQIYKLCGNTPATGFTVASTSSTAVPASKTCKKNGSATVMAW